MTQTNVSGDSITRVGLLYECKCRSVRTTDWHSSSSRVEKPRAPINGGEIIFQRPPATGTPTYYYLQIHRCNKRSTFGRNLQRIGQSNIIERIYLPGLSPMDCKNGRSQRAATSECEWMLSEHAVGSPGLRDEPDCCCC